MITQLAPLGATHNIVLVLAYGEIAQPTPTGEPWPGAASGEAIRSVTVTVHLKPKDGVKGEPRDLQFTGPACDVEAELKDKLPLVTQKLVTHLASLDALDAELKAEQEKAQKDHEAKKTSAANTVRTGVKSTTRYPAKETPKAEPKEEKEEPKEEAKPTTKAKGKAKPTVAAAAGTAAAALEKLRSGNTTPAETPAAEESAAPDLAGLAAKFTTAAGATTTTTETDVEL